MAIPELSLCDSVAAKYLETIHFGPEYCGRALPLRRAANGEMEMNAQATKLQAAENDLKQLMADRRRPRAGGAARRCARCAWRGTAGRVSMLVQ